MARGKRSIYTNFLECVFKDRTVFLQQKVQHHKKVAWYTFEVVEDTKTIEKARGKGFHMHTINDPIKMPFEALEEYKKIQSLQQSLV